MTSIDIAEPLREICQRLGLVYENVAHIDFRPSRLVADVYVLNESCHKHLRIGEDGSQESAIEMHTFKVTT